MSFFTKLAKGLGKRTGKTRIATIGRKFSNAPAVQTLGHVVGVAVPAIATGGLASAFSAAASAGTLGAKAATASKLFQTAKASKAGLIFQRVQKGIDIAQQIAGVAQMLRAPKPQIIEQSGVLSLEDAVIPDQTDALTPLGDAQTAALPPAMTLPRSPGGNMSLVKQLPNILGTISQLSALRRPKATAMQVSPTSNLGRNALSFSRMTGFPISPSSSLAPIQLPRGVTRLGFRKPRRTNPTNVKALRRALRRVEGFIKLEKRVDKIVRRMAPARLHRQARSSGFVRSRKR